MSFWKYFMLFLTLPIHSAISQNLIPNHSFEVMEDYDCTDPISGFVNLTDWYSWGTPHVYRYGCRYDTLVWQEFLPSIKATEGLNTLGLIGNLHVDGHYGSTTMAAALHEPLKMGDRYYFQVYASNRGGFHQYRDSLKVCDTDPPRGISTYFGDEFLMDSIILARKPAFLRFSAPELEDTLNTPWMLFSDCFVADDNHSHIAVDQNRGEVVMEPPCEVRDIAQGLVYFGYHTRIDELVLYRIPNEIDSTLISCRSQAFDVDLRKIAGLPAAVEASFEWQDGYSEPCVRYTR